jgi:hypothetical protein
MSDSFLSRWSKRKLEARTKEEFAEVTPPIESNSLLHETREVGHHTAVVKPAEAIPTDKSPSQPELPLPTEADLLAVKQGGDIKAFMVDKVSTELKNKAFKALFSRPEFNVMDGLDIYIDDYSKFTPLSQEDIGKMTLSKQLLSRPDLEMLAKPEIDEGLERVGAVLSETDGPGSPVLDKTDVSDNFEVEKSDLRNEVRVIPDQLQDIDKIKELENRSFESSDKK